jgi:hypothetical protein
MAIKAMYGNVTGVVLSAEASSRQLGYVHKVLQGYLLAKQMVNMLLCS